MRLHALKLSLWQFEDPLATLWHAVVAAVPYPTHT